MAKKNIPNTLEIANCDFRPTTPLLTGEYIQSCIYVIRGKQVILDRDLAQLYQVETSQMNRQVKRNIQRFPKDFMFQYIKGATWQTKYQHTLTKEWNFLLKIGAKRFTLSATWHPSFKRPTMQLSHRQ